MNSELHQIIYISSAEPSLTQDELIDLLSESQKRNASLDITGLLLHSDGSIIQILEGPKDSTTELFNRISEDPRHRAVTVISSKPTAVRDFPNFKMGFKRVSCEDFEKQLPHFSRIVDENNLPDDYIAGMSKLVSTFLKTFARTTNIDRFGNNVAG